MITNNKDIVIFTNGNIFAFIILSSFLKKYKNRIATIVIVNGDYKGNGGIVAIIKYLKSTTIFYFFYKITTLFILKFIKNELISSVEGLSKLYNISNIKIANINDSKLYENIKQKKCKYLISVSCPQLINKKWLELFNYKGINIHSSLLPKYAGLAPYFWVLVNKEKITGVTIHYLVKGFDKGNILEQAELRIEQKETCFKLFIKQSLIAKDLLLSAFDKLNKNDAGQPQLMQNFSYYSNPDTLSYIKLKLNKYSLIRLSDISFLLKCLKSIAL